MTEKVTAILLCVFGLLAMLISTAAVTYEGSLLWGIFLVFAAGFISFVVTVTLFSIAMVQFSKAKRLRNEKYSRAAWVLIVLTLPLNIIITLFNIHAYMNPVHWAFG